MPSPFGIDAIVVNTVRRGPGQMTGLGFGDPNMGDNFLTNLADSLTGGAISSTEQQLATLKLMLQISIGASIVSGVFALVAIMRGRS